ncbi:ribonuclease P protein component [Pseudoponticoccus marisrubri]|uniref:Ribonuclease P protein component n=1 Tax=Pseudoponticoccus marisrubri TaxID=1685382 RepID=A0A0W7WQJ3_9RHOB|nr:ribonuclease P protein component [Pseudoponticoccus marisrubri]KUF12844.1 ribonuclease P protein component [Pseudoponticoccus marisrubri]
MTDAEKAATEHPGAAFSSCAVLRKRADFLRAARARRAPCPAFLLQARQRQPGEAVGIRVGFTCSKKVGNAVARNRAKRRLREIARLVLPEHGQPGWDYVLIGRRDDTATRDFAEMQQDLRRALRKIHGGRA